MKKSKAVMSMVLSFLCILQLSLSGCSQTVITPSEPEADTITVDSSNNIPTTKDDELDSENDSEDYEETEESFDKDNSFVMPNVIGKNCGEAEDIIDELGLEYKIEYKYVENIELYKVVSQIPDENTPLSSDTVVKLIVCDKEKKNVSDNNSKPKSESKAESKIEEKTEPQTIDVVESTVSEQTAIADNTQKMPDLVGMNSDNAMSTLTSMGIYYTGNYQFDNNIPKGQVISQEPAAGTDAPKGSRVTFIISDGPQPEQQVVTYEITQPTQTTQTTQTTEYAATEVRNADNYLGRWYSFRPYAKISEWDNGQYYVEIRWTGSATEAIDWIMFADYNPSNGTLTYKDGKELSTYYDRTRREWRRHYAYKYYLCGYFTLNSNGELLWFDDGVPRSSEIVFHHE